NDCVEHPCTPDHDASLSKSDCGSEALAANLDSRTRKYIYIMGLRYWRLDSGALQAMQEA
ncbi:hypothetical protein, partial [Dokdonella sp.]|uniref:hypothetical protein n=1 Tax=Dokdonella sp. TaxID=2291710 RepID=UPI003C3E16DD